MEILFKSLSDAQASLFLLFQKTWVYHWHVVGPDFKQIHDLFGEQYQAIQEEVDRISEHMRFLGIKPISSLSRVVEVSGVEEAKTNISDDATMLEIFYKYQVSDNISITPALFYVSNNQRFQNESAWGGVVQTKFTF